MKEVLILCWTTPTEFWHKEQIDATGHYYDEAFRMQKIAEGKAKGWKLEAWEFDNKCQTTKDLNNFITEGHGW